jgi:hypothetical protein
VLSDDYPVQQVTDASHVQLLEVLHAILVRNFWWLLQWHLAQLVLFERSEKIYNYITACIKIEKNVIYKNTAYDIYLQR